MTDPQVKVAITATDEASAKMTNVGAGMDKLGSVSTNTMANMVSAFGQASAAMSQLGASIEAVTGEVVEKFASFDQAMYDTQSVLGATEGEFEKLREFGMKLGQDLPVSAREAADGFYTLASSGWDVNQVMAETDTIMKAAVAGNTEFATAAGLATATLGKYADQGYDTDRIMDIMLQTVKMGRTTLLELADTMPYVVSGAADAGVSLEDLGAAIDQVRNAGIPATMAGTALNQMIVKLAKPTEGAIALIEEFGIEMVKNADGGLDLVATMIAMSDSLSGLEPGLERTAILQELFGIRGSKAAAAMLTNTDALRENRAAMDDSGVVLDAYNTQMEGAAKQLELLEGRLENVKIQFGEKLTPAQIKVNQLTIGFYEALLKIHPQLLEFGGAFLIIAGNVFTAIAPMLQLMSSIMMMATLRSALGAATMTQTAALVLNTIATKASAAATWLWNAALMANPLVLIAMAILGVVALLWVLESQTGAVSGAWETLNEGFHKYIGTSQTMRAEMDELMATQDTLLGSLEELQTTFDDLEAEVGVIDTEIGGLNDTLTDNQIAISHIDIGMRGLEDTLADQEASLKNLDATLATTDTEYRNMTDTLSDQEATLSDLEGSYQSAMDSINALSDASRDFSQEQQSNRLQIMRIEKEARDQGRELSEAELAQIDLLKNSNKDLALSIAEKRLEESHAREEAEKMADAMDLQSTAISATEESIESYVETERTALQAAIAETNKSMDVEKAKVEDLRDANEELSLAITELRVVKGGLTDQQAELNTEMEGYNTELEDNKDAMKKAEEGSWDLKDVLMLALIGPLGEAIFNWDDFSKRLEGASEMFGDWGSGLGTAFTDGISDAIEGGGGWIDEGTETIKEWLGFSSPPPKGALHDVPEWGEHLAETYLEGITQGMGRAGEILEVSRPGEGATTTYNQQRYNQQQYQPRISINSPMNISDPIQARKFFQKMGKYMMNA
ncbi:phage tail tape measure protein [Candidatus Pacearchaeota archaeon]|nr:phage tail tape measure protein [Candidatus Pacearchaeota archaeon]